MIPYHHMSNRLSAPVRRERAMPTALLMPMAMPSRESAPAAIPKRRAVIVGEIAAPLRTRTTPRCHTIGEV